MCLCNTPKSMYQELLKQVDNDTLILTGNKRLARRLQTEFASQQHTVWKTLNALPLYNWLEKHYADALAQGHASAATLLNTAQEQILWEKIITESRGSELLNPVATAKQASGAWALLQQYQLKINDARLTTSEAGKTFISWAKRFFKICLDNAWLAPANLPDTIKDLLAKDHITLPRKIILIGFLELSPQLKSLINQLEKHSEVIQYSSPANSKSTSFQTSLPDELTEIKTMANWCKTIIAESPQARIACIAPNLTEQQKIIGRCLAESLSPDNFNISASTPLAQEPLVNSALNILQSKCGKLSINNWSKLLRSPFLSAYIQESQQRAILDLELREEHFQLSLKGLLRSIKRCPLLEKHLYDFQKLPLPKKQSAHAWAKTFSEWLAKVQWPGERVLSTREYQALQQWQHLLDNFAQLNIVSDTLHFQEALNRLTQLAEEQSFHLKTHDAPIQIMGTLESIELHFSHIWVMGLSERLWPSAPQANAFLPYPLQREYEMPHSSAARELLFSEQMMSQWLKHSPQIIFSYAQMKDGIPQQASGLISDYALLNQPSEITVPDINAKHWEFFSDDYAPSIQPDETIRGGTWIFKQQAACPFRAFADCRLQAESIATPTDGITAAERGSLVHLALELFWQETRSHKGLCALTNDAQEIRLKQHITQAMNEIIQKESLPQVIADIEAARTLKLLTAWLELEKTREAFTVISQEKWERLEVNGIPLRLQIDRIDQLADGSHIIIDYKTGLTTLASWFGDRLDEPQLPLYAMIHDKYLSGLYFAQIRLDKMAFKGLTQVEGQLPGAKTLAELNYDAVHDNWAAQLNDWKAVLKALAEDFKKGLAPVDPKYGAQTCQYCNLQTLCRVHEH